MNPAAPPFVDASEIEEGKVLVAPSIKSVPWPAGEDVCPDATRAGEPDFSVMLHTARVFGSPVR